MQKSAAGRLRSVTGKQQAAANDYPFLPDLCTLQAVLLLVLGTELLALVVTLLASPLAQFDWPLLGQVSMLILWIVLSSAALLCQARRWLASIPNWLAGTICYLGVLALALFFCTAGQLLILGQINGGELLRSMAVAAIVSGVVLRYLVLQQQLDNHQRAKNLAQLHALHARIRPHFLFNSLNAAVSLIAIDAARAERLILNLCDLFRAAIADPALVSLNTELALAKQYLDIESQRLGDRLRVSWQINIDDGDAVIPSMVLQPILENAVFYGIEPKTEGGQIAIEVTASGERQVTLAISNPALCEDQQPLRRGNGIAHENIQARLKAHFGNQVTFVANQHGDRYYVHLNYQW